MEENKIENARENIKKKKREEKLIKLNNIIDALAKEYIEAREREDYKTEEIIEKKANKLIIPFSTLIQLEPINMLYYINMNDKVMSRRSFMEGVAIINNLMKINMSSYTIKKEMVTFISWSSGYNYTDKQILKLVKKLCNRSTMNDSNILLTL